MMNNTRNTILPTDKQLVSRLAAIQGSVHNLRERVRDDDAADRMANEIGARLGMIISELQHEQEEKR